MTMIGAMPQQAFFDTTLAGQQFGGGKEQLDLLRDLAESYRAINDKICSGFRVV